MSYQRWEIWLAQLDPVVGSEQGKTRPVLIVSRQDAIDVLPVITVVPLTSRKPGRKVYSNEALLPISSGGLVNESIALCYQVRTLDKSRFTRRIGILQEEALQIAVIEALRFHLPLP
jgi:mRNA interferase MazF